MNHRFVSRVSVVATLGAGLLLASSAAAQNPVPTPAAGQVSQGFALHAGVATIPFAIDDDLLGLTSLTGSIGVGYKIDRLIIGATFDFTRFGSSSTSSFDDGTGTIITQTTDRTDYNFVVGPELQVALMRSPDQRAELVGSVGVLLGTWDSESTTTGGPPDPNPPPEPDQTRLLVRWRLAPGVRYWMHPNIAFSGFVGFNGTHQIRDTEDPSLPNFTDSRSAGVVSLYSQFGLTGVF